MVDLIERLRGYRPQNEWGDGVKHTICNEAADEIERLHAGIKRLTDEEERCAETTGDDPFSMVYLAAKLASTEAECKRLHAAMKEVEDYHRAKSSEIWEVSRDGLSDDQKKEYGIAWCVHAASAYAIKTLITPEAKGRADE